MNYGALIGRAWQITWRYKVLWIFGILLALVTGGGGSNGGGSGMTYGTPMTAESGAFGSLFAGLALACCCALLILIVVAIIVQYVARTALYRGVDQIEETSVGPTWREGFRLGWSNRALRMFLLDLIVGVAFFIAAMLLLMLGAAPLILLVFDNDVARVLGIAATVGLEMLVIFLLVAVGVVISVLGQFWRREIALADRTVGEAFGNGIALARSQGGNVAVMWLLLAAIGIVFALFVAAVAFGLFLFGLATGGGLGYAIYSITDAPLLGTLAGLPIFLLVVILPVAIIRGIYLVFDASAWTLVYREVTGAAAGAAASLALAE